MTDGDAAQQKPKLLVALAVFGLVIGVLFFLFGGGCFIYFAFGFLSNSSAGATDVIYRLMLVITLSSAPILGGLALIRACHRLLNG